MKKMFCRRLLACVCLAGVALASPAFAAYDGPKFSFRVAHTTPPGNHITLAFEKFKELVEKKSDGRISVQIFPNALLRPRTHGRSPKGKPRDGGELHPQYG